MLGFTVVLLLCTVGIRGEDATTDPPRPDFIKIVYSNESYILVQSTKSLQQTTSAAKKAMPSDTPDEKKQQETLDKLYEIANSSSGDIHNVEEVLKFFTSFKTDFEGVLPNIQAMLIKAEGSSKEELQKAIRYIQQSLLLVEKLIRFCEDSEAGLPIPDPCLSRWLPKD